MVAPRVSQLQGIHFWLGRLLSIRLVVSKPTQFLGSCRRVPHQVLMQYCPALPCRVPCCALCCVLRPVQALVLTGASHSSRWHASTRLQQVRLSASSQRPYRGRPWTPLLSWQSLVGWGVTASLAPSLPSQTYCWSSL